MPVLVSDSRAALSLRALEQVAADQTAPPAARVAAARALLEYEQLLGSRAPDRRQGPPDPAAMSAAELAAAAVPAAGTVDPFA